MRGNHLEALTALWLQHPLFFFFLLSLCSSPSPSSSLLLCFLSSFHSVSLPRCMSSHQNYCRHCCRIWTTPTGLTGKVNKLLKMKNSAGVSGVIYSLHLLFLLLFPSRPRPAGAFYPPSIFTVCTGAVLQKAALTALCWFLRWFTSLFVFYVCFSVHISFHTFFITPPPLFFLLSWLFFAVFVFSLLLFLFSPSRYIGVLTTWDKLSVLTPWILLTVAVLLLASFVLLFPPLLCFFFLLLCIFPHSPLCFGFPLLCFHSHSGSDWMWFWISNRLSASVFSLFEKIMEAKVINDTDLLFAFTRGILALSPCRQVRQGFMHMLWERATDYMARSLWTLHPHTLD